MILKINFKEELTNEEIKEEIVMKFIPRIEYQSRGKIGSYVKKGLK